MPKSIKVRVKDPACSFAKVLTDELKKIHKAREDRGVVQSQRLEALPAGPTQALLPAAAASAKPGILGRVSDLAKGATKIVTAKFVPALTARYESFLKCLDIGVGLHEEKQVATPTNEALQMDLVGVALSGGGIRSATFSLGILQGLADKGMLRHVDYLSTVSGGGYIGSWLASWIRNADKNSPKEKFDHVQEQLRSAEADTTSEPLQPIHNLRRYSNYLTPKVSFFSADAWTMAAIWTRNTLLNFAIILCGLTVLLLLPRLAGAVLPEAGTWSLAGRFEAGIIALCLSIAIASLGFNLNVVNDDRKSRTGPGNDQDSRAGQRGVQWRIVIPLVVASAALAESLYRTPSLLIDHWLQVPWIVLSALFFAVAWLGNFPDCFKRQHRQFKPALAWALGYGLAIGASILSGLGTAAMLHGTAILFSDGEKDLRPWVLLCLGPPVLLLVLALGMVLQIGLMGHDLPDASREWLGRLRAWVMIYGSGWLAVTGISVFGPYSVYWAGSAGTVSAGALWGAISATGLFAGKSPKTKGDPVPEETDWKHLGLEAVSRVAPFVFILGFALFVAVGIHELVSGPAQDVAAQAQPKTVTLDGKPDEITLTVGRIPKTPSYFEKRKGNYASDLKTAQTGIWRPQQIDFDALGTLFLLFLVVGLILSWRVDINDFSMHHFYKNRLVRCYLGASRRKRSPDPFVGFDSKDDVPLKDFAEEDYCGPYPILNASLNLAGGNLLTWQERKAASFVFTPLYCGYDKPQVDREAANPRDDDKPISEYGYSGTNDFAYDEGIKIGTAMGISGAAASPNAGYHTSTAISFLLTLFNVRLGWWVGNPARLGKASKPSPVFGLPYLAVELFGLANTDKAFVNISDGGHFENLGIYELVRRRCRYLIVCDGEQDGSMKFEGLANAVRKCRTDFGVDIEIDLDQLRRKNGFSSAHCVVGKFVYPETRNTQCYLLYFKSSLTGNEETDVLQYHSKHPEFPHQSTGDQWFSESQFESYRKLGLHVANAALSAVPEKLFEDLDRQSNDLQKYSKAKANFFEELWNLLYPPSEAIRRSFTRHADAYTKLVETIGAKPIADMDEVIFSEWSEPKLHEGRQVRYLCTSFVQLMENVFLDLNLEDPQQRNHPHNAGWLQLFRKWVATPAFRDAWNVARSTYGRRFHRFYESLILQETSHLTGVWEASSAAPEVIKNLSRVQIERNAANTMSGRVTAGSDEHEMINPDYYQTAIVFELPAAEGGRRKYRMRVDERGHGVLAVDGDEEPRITLTKTAA